MNVQQFVKKWQASTLKERSASQSHFNDLCELLGEPKPVDVDPDGTWYTFERGAKKTGGGDGWADVWKRGHFAWEYKGKHKDLTAAFAQLQRYAIALENPPLLVVSDMETIVIHTSFTNTVQEIHTIALEDIGTPENQQKLNWLFSEPDRFRPGRTTFAVTEEAATRMGEIAKRLTERGIEPHVVAHFLIQCVFCMFAEDARLLPEKLFETVLDKSNPDGSKAQKRLTELFEAMQSGGDFALNEIPWFNGGLFKRIDVPALQTADVVSLLEAARMDWSAVEPAILGTLFERGLNPDMRSQLGAHYTDPGTILKLIGPVVEQPLLAEWEASRGKIAAAMEIYNQGGKKAAAAHKQAQALFVGFLERLKAFRVLDPACGSGNFLYLSLKALKDLEHRANLEAEALDLQRQISIETSPANVLGIELNPYAAELARVTVWIGEIQWMLAHGYAVRRNPILAPLDHIECRDAVLDLSLGTDITIRDEQGNIIGTKGQIWAAAEPDWPAVDVIIGNPPFLGGSKLLRELGDEYTEALRGWYKGRVPGGADLVTYWFEKARTHIEAGKAKYAGLVATNSIRGGANRKVLERILNTPRPHAGRAKRGGRSRPGERENLAIFNAWSDEEWVNNGAAVRVSLVCFGLVPSSPPLLPEGEGGKSPSPSGITSDLPACGPSRLASSSTRGVGVRVSLDGRPVDTIHADLTAGNETSGALDLTQAKPLKENRGVSFRGTTKNGAFDISGELARRWIKLPNPNGRSNAEVVKPWMNGKDITARSSDTWIIDFGVSMPEIDAALYEVPYAHTLKNVQAERQKNNREAYRLNWWIFGEARPGLRSLLSVLPRFIATSMVAKHRLFVWRSTAILPDQQVIAIAHSDDATFGILHSRFHELWSLRMGTSLEDRPRYTPTTTFETFPFPAGFAPSSPALLPAGEGSESPSPSGITSDLPACGSSRLASSSTRGVGVRERISAAAQNLNKLRENWLNPPEWVDWVRTPEEEKANFPARPVAKPGHEAELKKRTLTNLYNARPAWLANAHRELDAAVATAYGWDDYTPEMPDEEILRRLLALNLDRSRG
jgi:hypothetical protein